MCDTDVMRSFFFCNFVTQILWDAALSQVLGYETTPFSLPPTSFSCQGRSPGYYADLETECRTYHVCDGNSHFTYICPARTLFQQTSKICDHAYLVRCGGEIYPENEDEILLRLPNLKDQAYTENIDQFNTQTEEFFATETIEPIEIPTTRTTATTKKPTTIPIPKFPSESPKGNDTSVNYSDQTNKILKFVIKDIRSLFYIPELGNNSITVQAEREFALPVDRKNLMRFRNGKKARHSFSACPSYCDPKFFLPGTCHPCIMIK